jgi:hypothetical protein
MFQFDGFYEESIPSIPFLDEPDKPGGIEIFTRVTFRITCAQVRIFIDPLMDRDKMLETLHCLVSQIENGLGDDARPAEPWLQDTDLLAGRTFSDDGQPAHLQSGPGPHARPDARRNADSDRTAQGRTREAWPSGQDSDNEPNERRRTMNEDSTYLVWRQTLAAGIRANDDSNLSTEERAKMADAIDAGSYDVVLPAEMEGE